MKYWLSTGVRSVSGQLQALIFDVDGTLADTERHGHRVAFNLAFQEAGLPVHLDELEYQQLLVIGGGRERLLYYFAQHPALVEAEHAASLAAELHQRKTRIYTELVRGGAIPFRPGVERLLREGRELGLRLAVATTSHPQAAIALIESNLGDGSAHEWFDPLLAGNVVARKKPDPSIYALALTQLNLPASACLAIEDSRNGLLAALGAGLGCIVTVNSYTRHEDLRGAALVVSDLEATEPVGATPEVLADPLEVGPSTQVDVALLRQIQQRLTSSAISMG
ncbi:MAG: HAD-IA family hydrolase [Gemmatimonadaceae bacterium]|nr:HAD-IA family hydrolase [Gloeobacterales cyanobacterium ES-bin-141]